MNRFFHSCRRLRPDFCLLAAGVLPEPEQARITAHLAACPGCRNYYGELTAVTGALAHWPEDYSALQPRPAAPLRWAQAVAAAGRPEGLASVANALREGWRDVILPARRIWAGLAAAWVLILAGNLSLSGVAPARSLPMTASVPALIRSFKEQQIILAELLAEPARPQLAARPGFFSPKPRTEITRLEIA